MADHGRVVCCGTVAGYNGAEDAMTNAGAAPHALVAMLAGENVGQVVVRVGPDRS